MNCNLEEVQRGEANEQTTVRVAPNDPQYHGLVASGGRDGPRVNLDTSARREIIISNPAFDPDPDTALDYESREEEFATDHGYANWITDQLCVAYAVGYLAKPADIRDIPFRNLVYLRPRYSGPRALHSRAVEIERCSRPSSSKRRQRSGPKG
ncbi:hypothetical protein EVAR_48058_1 [Eumeta japonica]|uniref:Uncharacterized protein n=1 Tax=Eumeta variegata TaxID=151549 RepID=A0A4C1X7D2_EUMVA|nr:hypothetical protein EVAR_48058_1 [Eumeta japonica]